MAQVAENHGIKQHAVVTEKEFLAARKELHPRTSVARRVPTLITLTE